MSWSRQRVYASLVAFGISILLFRTVVMLTDGSLAVLATWVSALLVVECALDMTTFLGSARWWITTAERHARLPLRAAAAAIILHAVRVFIFVLGRTGPWIDFDVRPEHRVFHSERWSWASVYFAAVLAALGVVGVLTIWRYRRRAVNSGRRTRRSST